MNMQKRFKTSNGIKAVLFDIDGVLLDSFEAGLHFLGDILVAMGYPRPTRRMFKNNFHLPLRTALQKLAKSELIEELERLHEIVPSVPYRKELLKEPEGLRETLKLLRQTYKLGIITSRNKEGLSGRYFSFSNTKKYFSVWITVEDVKHHKPHPEPLLLAAKKLKLQPSECVYVGDSHTDVEAGKAAGMKTILYGGKINAGADASTKTFKKLPEIVASLN